MKFFLGVLFVLLMTLMSTVTAQANLQVNPTFVALDDKKQRSAVFSLVNNSSQFARYNIYFEDKASQSTDVKQTTETSATSVANLVRYSPRRVSLESGQGTRVRMALRLPKGTKKGEYFSNIVFHQIPVAAPAVNTDSLPEKNAAENTSNSRGLSMTAYMRIIVPVILRVGDLTSTVEIATAQQAENTTSIEVVLSRQGDRTSFGNIEIIEMAEGKEVATLGHYRDAIIHILRAERRFVVDIAKSLPSGTELLIRYRESASLPQAKTIERQLIL